MLKTLNSLIIITMLMTIYSCKTSTNDDINRNALSESNFESKGELDDNDQKIGLWTYSMDEYKYQINWKPIIREGLQIIVKDDWIPIEDTIAEILFRPNILSKEYIVLVANATKELSLESYVDTVTHWVIKNRNPQKPILYNTQTSDGDKSFILFFASFEDDSTLYRYASFYTIKEGIVYDLTMKVKDSTFLYNTLNQSVFAETIESIRINGVKLIQGEVVTSKKVELLKLKNS